MVTVAFNYQLHQTGSTWMMQNLFWEGAYMVSVVVLCIFAAVTVRIYCVPLVCSSNIYAAAAMRSHHFEKIPPVSSETITALENLREEYPYEDELRCGIKKITLSSL